MSEKNVTVRKIKVNDKVMELTDACHWTIRNSVLWNLNTNCDEGVEGDIVEYQTNGVKYRGHVVGYTCSQFITTEEWGSIVLSAVDDPRPLFTHINKVEIVEEDE